MFSRSLVLLGLGVALAFGAPAASLAQQVQKPPVTASAEKPVKKPVKKAAKKQVSKKQIAKKGRKGKADAKPAEAVEEKPRGLFASLFGSPKDRSAKVEKIAAKADR